MSITGISRNRRAIWQVETPVPPDKTGVYQFGSPFQISPTEIGIGLNIRWSGVKTIDLEIGNDLLIMDHFSAINPQRIQALNRCDIKPHPRSRKPTLFARYPLIGGFVPFKALRPDGTPHPYAGTGFAVGKCIGFPGDRIVSNEMEYEDADQYQYQELEIKQYSYDGTDFRILDTDFISHHHLLEGWNLQNIGLSSAIPDGDDLLQPFVGGRAGKNEPMGSGVLRWRYIDGAWRPADFTPVTNLDDAHGQTDEDPEWAYSNGQWRIVDAVEKKSKRADNNSGYLSSELVSPYTEPSMIRDRDGALLFTARAQGTQPYAPGPLSAERVCVWRSTDGCSWTKILNIPHIRALTPVTLNRATDGTVYLAVNPACRTNSLGQRLGSIIMREKLMIWPLSEDRRSLLEPLTVRDCPEEFGKPPNGSFWRIDHPVGLTVRLSDDKWRHIITYRGLEHNECDSDAQVTPFTGTYIEEVYSNGDIAPVWNF